MNENNEQFDNVGALGQKTIKSFYTFFYIMFKTQI